MGMAISPSEQAAVDSADTEGGCQWRYFGW
jgi:hypothetical protein